MSLIDFEQRMPSRRQFLNERKLRTKKILFDVIDTCNTNKRTVTLNKLRPYIMGLLVVTNKEFNDALINLKENRRIQVHADMVLTTKQFEECLN